MQLESVGSQKMEKAIKKTMEKNETMINKVVLKKTNSIKNQSLPLIDTVPNVVGFSNLVLNCHT